MSEREENIVLTKLTELTAEIQQLRSRMDEILGPQPQISAVGKVLVSGKEVDLHENEKIASLQKEILGLL